MAQKPDLQSALDKLEEINAPAARAVREAVAPTDSGPTVTLRELKQTTIHVPVVGVTPLILHKWSEKALRMMREKQQGQRMQTKRDPKSPEEEAESSTYYLYLDPITNEYVLPDQYPGEPETLQKVVAVPATQFKTAIVGAVRYFDGITMVQTKQSLFVEGDPATQLIPLQFGTRILREDAVRNQSGVADLRYRYAYYPWSIDFSIRFVATIWNTESILALVNAAGLGGIGDWRPSAPKVASGTFGQFRVDKDKEIRVVE